MERKLLLGEVLCERWMGVEGFGMIGRESVEIWVG
jgi:hypothetical protein